MISWIVTVLAIEFSVDVRASLEGRLQLSARLRGGGLHLFDLRRDLVDVQLVYLLLVLDEGFRRRSIFVQQYLELADPGAQRLRSAGGFECRDDLGSLADFARQDREPFGIERRLGAPVGDPHGQQLCVEFVAQADNLFIPTAPRLRDDGGRRIRQLVAAVVQLLLLRLHFLDGIEQRLRQRLIGGDVRLQSVVKLSALLREGRLRGLAQRCHNPTGEFPILFRRRLVMVVGETQRAAPHRFKVMFDLQHTVGVFSQRIHFCDVGFDAVEFRDGIDG